MALGLVALVLAILSYSFSATSAQAKPKPKYRLSVHIYGVPSKITLDQPYTYTIKIKNTGRLKFKRVVMVYWNARFVTGTSPMYNKAIKPDRPGGPSGVAWLNIANVKPGATRVFKIFVTYNDPSQVTPYNGDSVRALVQDWNTPLIVDVQKGAMY